MLLFVLVLLEKSDKGKYVGIGVNEDMDFWTSLVTARVTNPTPDLAAAIADK